MVIELNSYGLLCESQKPIHVYYNNNRVGDYFADVVVNQIIILELKAASALIEEHEIQLINYLKATKMEVGLLLNFGREHEFKRKLFTNDKKLIAHR